MAVFIIEVVRGVFDRHSQAFTPGWLRMCDGPTIVQLSWVLWSVCTVQYTAFTPVERVLIQTLIQKNSNGLLGLNGCREEPVTCFRRWAP